MASALRVFAGPGAEVEAYCYPVGNVVGSGVKGAGWHGDDVENNYQGGGLFSFGWGGVLELVDLELMCEALVDTGVILINGWFPGVGETIQEVGNYNYPPCLRNQLFPKSVHKALGVIGVPNAVAIDLEELDVGGVWILESRINQQGGI